MSNDLNRRENSIPNNPVLNAWLRKILEKVQSQEIPVEQAMQELSILPYEELGFAQIDHHRSLRSGLPEVIFGRGKTCKQIITIATSLISRSDRLLITQTSLEVYQSLRKAIDDAVYHPLARAITVNRCHDQINKPGIIVISAGTADIPVAEEAVVTAELMGNRVEKIYDIGVAGLHRLLDKLPRLRTAKVLVVVAGMEGALPGVIGGLVPVPVIAVPTSTGYGASFDGLAALLTMLNSCAPGVAVVNIDNGFGAGYLAGLINNAGQEAVDGEKC